MSIFHWVEHYQDLRLEHLPEMPAAKTLVNIEKLGWRFQIEMKNPVA